MRTVLILSFGIMLNFPGRAQSIEAQQLLLNWEKLAQFKSILKNMQKGYEVLSGGYTRIKNISEGNYSLHQDFLDGLLEVSPGVRKYRRVGDVIAYQSTILRQQKEALTYFNRCGSFSSEELAYLGAVYNRLLQESLKTLDELGMVITSGKLRMSDEERLTAIDRIYADMQEKLHFIYAFNKSTWVLSLQRINETASMERAKRLQGLK